MKKRLLLGIFLMIAGISLFSMEGRCAHRATTREISASSTRRNQRAEQTNFVAYTAKMDALIERLNILATQVDADNDLTQSTRRQLVKLSHEFVAERAKAMEAMKRIRPRL